MTTDIVGTIAYNPTDGRLMIYDIDPDTLPQNTLAAVDSVINPQLKGPEVGLPLASNGQRYLLVDDVGSANNTEPSSVWGNLIASANDIIEYDGISNEWFVSFDSALPTDIQFVTNLTSGVQYRFIDNMWTKSWEGWYAAGDFSIVI